MPAALLQVPAVDPERRDRRKWAVILGILTGLGPLAIDAYLPSLPTIERELATSAGAVQLTLAAYFLGLASGQLLWGPIADRRGRRKPLLVGLVLYAIGSAIAALAPSIEVLIGARALQALGGSAGVVVVRAVIRDRWAGREGAQMMSMVVLVMGAAPVLAPSLGGLLLAIGSWRMIFALLTVVALIVLAIIHRHLPETGTPGRRESLLSGAGHVLRDGRFVAYALATGTSMAGMFAYISGSPFVFIDLLELDPSVFAVVFGVNAAGYVAASQLNARLLRSRDHTAVAMVASSVTAVIGLALLLASTSGHPSAWLLGALVLAYVTSLGFGAANTTAAALENHAGRAGLASALLGAGQFATAALTAASVGALADGTARPMALVMVACAALALTCVTLGRRTSVIPAEARTA